MINTDYLYKPGVRLLVADVGGELEALDSVPVEFGGVSVGE